MFRVACLLAASASLLLASQSIAAADPSLIADAKAFGAREEVQAMDVSPSGRRLLVVMSGPGLSNSLKVIDLETKQGKLILSADGKPESIHWCQFASDIQLVCEYGGLADLNGDIIGFSRLVTLTADGKNLKPLGQRSRRTDAGIRQFDGEILDWLPDDQGSVLMARNYVPEANTLGTNISDKRSGVGVDRMELASLKASRVESPREDVGSYMTDGRGNVRLIDFRQTDHAGRLTGILNFRFRTAGSREWKPLGEYNVRDGSGIYPLAIDGGSDSLYLLRKTDGRDALYRMKLDGSATTTLVAANSKVDISSVVRLGRGQRVIGYTFVDDRRRTFYFDPEFKKLAATLGKALPKQPVITFEGASADGSRLLVFARGDAHPGSFYYLDKATLRMDELALVRPELEGRNLAAVRSINIPAADGVQIPAYLTLPTAGGTNLPAIVLPHGGPSARDEWGFDWLAQFFAARGYAVVQPNFRGSAGYGDNWLGENAFQNWRTAVGDVSTAAKYLVSQGIADPNRLAIVGWSYGGYAALQSAATEPSLYKAVAAIAPVTDLALLKQDSRNFTSAGLVAKEIGSGPHVVEGSPLRRASSIRAPVLLVHGSKDANVRVWHSQKMHDALRGAGTQSELLLFDGLDHQLDDAAARTQMLTRIGELLQRTIGR
jgi:dipeptidyl aminopeptidase/acylaminoacyl peptidase